MKEGLAYQRRSGEIFCFGIGLKNKYSSFHLLHILINKTFQHLKCTIIALPQKSYFCHITLFNDPYILVPHCLCALKVPVYPYRWGLVGGYDKMCWTHLRVIGKLVLSLCHLPVSISSSGFNTTLAKFGSFRRLISSCALPTTASLISVSKKLACCCWATLVRRSIDRGIKS